MQPEIEDLMQHIGYQFHEIETLENALTHRSHSKMNNERLEFLGDSLVNFIVASELFERFPKAQEGHLSQLRANLVNEETLSEMAKEFHLGPALKLGFGEIKAKGAERPSILSDAMEAIVAAIYLDSGMEECYKKVSKWYQERFDHLSLDDIQKDPKSILQEYMQARQLPLPHYDLVSTMGEEHAQQFVVSCKIVTLDQPVTGEGTSRRRAEQDAAKHVLEALVHD
ncbi:MAG: ribonuclease III [Pseudomonadota bacterium]|nr:ribonuclease III [Gammaproteobacteria bacterium]MBU1559004.1 ribonuclease III [Gammaproteobacteria bacterium]MBU1926633.1 ribonuclease III [Gammaproteobacteria bacterium]MBU2545797.1 ribonuclease III [Gammaproteobacteria bacterium]